MKRLLLVALLSLFGVVLAWALSLAGLGFVVLRMQTRLADHPTDKA